MSGGKKNGARRVGDAGQSVEEFGLIGFDDQEIIGLLLFDQMRAGGFLGMQRIGTDQGAPQVQILEEFFETGDFVGFGGDLDLASEQLGLRV